MSALMQSNNARGGDTDDIYWCPICGTSPCNGNHVAPAHARRPWARISLWLMAGLIVLTACSTPANTVNSNITNEADNFNVYRDITFINGITDKAEFEIKGYCSLDTSNPRDLTATCKVAAGNGTDAYVRDYLGASDNMTWTSIQLNPSGVSPFHYEFNFRPETLIPDIRVN